MTGVVVDQSEALQVSVAAHQPRSLPGKVVDHAIDLRAIGDQGFTKDTHAEVGLRQIDAHRAVCTCGIHFLH